MAALLLCGGAPSHALAQQVAAESSACCYSELAVVTEGRERAFPGKPSIALPGRVSINGRYIGDTPLTDGFPAGDYEVMVEYQGVIAYRNVVRLIAGFRSRIVASVDLPLAAPATAQEAAVAAWNTEYAQWQRDTEARKAQRRARGIAGWVTLGTGAALVITGSALFVAANNQQDYAFSIADTLNAMSGTPEELEALEKENDDAIDRYMIMLPTAVAFVTIGGASFIASTVLFATRPAIAPEPMSPVDVARLRVTPYAAPSTAGLVLDGRF